MEWGAGKSRKRFQIRPHNQIKEKVKVNKRGFVSCLVVITPGRSGMTRVLKGSHSCDQVVTSVPIATDHYYIQQYGDTGTRDSCYVDSYRTKV